MCGIAGILLFQKQGLYVPAMLHSMANSLVHRGPDDEGYVLFTHNNDAITCGGKDTAATSWKNPYNYSAVRSVDEPLPDVVLGIAHRRLSVIDLSTAGHQPMCNEDASIWITCNGEIYNYIELRLELEGLGFVFKTKSDIEVLLKAYECWGMNFLEKLNGMWAFVIYDMRSNILLCCRDRFGVKPFYYTHNHKFFAFASEQKALMTLPIDKTIHDNAVFDYLQYGRVEEHETGFIEQIKELMPSHYFIYDLRQRKFSLNRYYRLPFAQETGKVDVQTSEQYIAATREKIYTAVDLRLRSDVPVGFCLSGGIDSSSIVGVAKSINDSKHLHQLQGYLHAFTATHGEHDCDESKWAAKVVDKHQMIWHQAGCDSGQMLDELEKIIWYQDSPLFSTSTYAQNVVMKAARENGITILLDGQGGDELFAGYVPFYISFFFELLRQYRLGRLSREWFHLKHSPLNVSILFRSMAKVKMDEKWTIERKEKLFLKKHAESAFFDPEYFVDHTPDLMLAPGYSSQSMNTLLHDYFTRWYLKNLLRWEDRCSMQYSIESRTPFADDLPLIESVFAIPSAYKIQQGWSKFLLRHAMRDVLPADIYRRSDKLGFATPQTFWLMKENSRMKSMMTDLASLDGSNTVNQKELLHFWDYIFSSPGQNHSQDFVWRYLNYLLWRKVNG